MQRKAISFLIMCTIATAFFTNSSVSAAAEEFVPGGSAALPAVSSYESWMQFETPDTNTPAIDTDGCLNYTLAKLSARYNLPVPGVSLLSDSYDYYTAFSEKVLSGGATKMDSLANQYQAYLTRQESVWLSGNLEERIAQAYAVCAETGTERSQSYILQMTTASGSDHYVLVDYIDTEQKRLYLLDSGSWYVEYLGDAKTMEKGYCITAVHPFHIFKMPGDTDGDFLLTQCDIDNLLHGAYEDTLSGDANHSGTADLSDAVYLAHLIQSVGHLSVQHALETEIPPPLQPHLPMRCPPSGTVRFFSDSLPNEKESACTVTVRTDSFLLHLRNPGCLPLQTV